MRPSWYEIWQCFGKQQPKRVVGSDALIDNEIFALRPNNDYGIKQSSGRLMGPPIGDLGDCRRPGEVIEPGS